MLYSFVRSREGDMDKKINIVKSIRQEGDTLTVELFGSLSVNNVADFDDALEGKLDGIQNLIIDMKKMTYLTSAGARSLIKAIKKLSEHGGKVTARHINNDSMTVLELLNIHKLITIEEE